MQYGYFDDANKEYVITRPDTPKSWSNYLGSTEYGAIITNNAGGTASYLGRAGTVPRLRFKRYPMDQPGRYIYLHDCEPGDYWSASWQPVREAARPIQVGMPPRNGLYGHYRRYAGIRDGNDLLRPPGQGLRVLAASKSPTWASVRAACGFHLRRVCGQLERLSTIWSTSSTRSYIVKMDVVGQHHRPRHATSTSPHARQPPWSSDQGRHTFLAVVGAEVSGYDTDRDAFIGNLPQLRAIRRRSSGASAPIRWPRATTGAARSRSISRSARAKRKEFVVLLGDRRGRRGRQADGGRYRHGASAPPGAGPAQALLAASGSAGSP